MKANSLRCIIQKAKPTSKRPVEHLILETRRKDELREQAIAETKYQKQCDLKVRLSPEIYHVLIIICCALILPRSIRRANVMFCIQYVKVLSSVDV